MRPQRKRGQPTASEWLGRRLRPWVDAFGLSGLRPIASRVARDGFVLGQIDSRFGVVPVAAAQRWLHDGDSKAIVPSPFDTDPRRRSDHVQRLGSAWAAWYARRNNAGTPRGFADALFMVLRGKALHLEDRTFLSRLLPVLVYSETEATGETVGDEIPDTDGDGIPEPAHAGGDFGRAPMFVGQIKEGPELEPGDGPILWSTHILPLFQANCAECHLGGAKRGEYRLDTPARLREPGTLNPGLPLVVPGDPEASYLYRKLVDRAPAAGDQMPLQQAPLSPHAKELVRLWILQGASAR